MPATGPRCHALQAGGQGGNRGRLYLDAQQAKAPLAVDLLLGTQGWRRFVLVDLSGAAAGDLGRRHRRERAGESFVIDIPQAVVAGSVTAQGGAAMPYSSSVSFHTLQPASSPQARVYLRTELKDRRVAEGEITEIDVTVSNTASEPIPTPVAIIGVPGGLEVRPRSRPATSADSLPGQ